jgi:hypothetical protein
MVLLLELVPANNRRSLVMTELVELSSYPQDPLLDNICCAIDSALKSLSKMQQPSFVVAGGYVRDWYQNQTPNDIDVYIFGDKECFRPNQFNNESFARALCNKFLFRSLFARQTYRFEIERMSRTSHFIDTTYIDGNNNVRVQFILSPIRGGVSNNSRYNSIEEVLASFDFAHCQFAFSPYDLKTYATPEALSSLETKTLQLSPRIANEMSRYMEHKIFSPENLFEIENLVKRTIKFLSRGMKLPLELDVASIIDTYCCNVEIASLRDIALPSAMLGKHELYDINQDRFLQSEIIKNLTKQWLLVAPLEDVARCMISPCKLIREVAEELAPLKLKT